MRLLNTSSLCVESIAPDRKPPYAILSHRWYDDEVSFQDIHVPVSRSKRGFKKIEGCCAIARRAGFSYIWIDTCCIDKTSSAELSEAINSMFRWYHEAIVCYAYLEDAAGFDDFCDSEWFDRGWTLQELVAPVELHFYSREWTMIGTLRQLSSIVSDKTGIDEAYLHGRDLAAATIAERMSWASNRKTMREEDTSYCLLGIFNIHMPLLYGEGGHNAFIRLQRELLKENHDHSWLAWQLVTDKKDKESTEDILSGVFAKSPSQFSRGRDIVVCNSDAVGLPGNETNAGIEMELPLITIGSQEFALLDCRWRHDFTNSIAIPLIEKRGRYFRASLDISVVPEPVWSQTKRSRVLLSPRSQKRTQASENEIYYIFSNMPDGFEIDKVHPPEAWRPASKHVLSGAPSATDSVRIVRMRYSKRNITPQHYCLVLWQHMREGVQGLDYRLGAVPEGYSLLECQAVVETKEAKIPGKPEVLVADLTKRVYFNKSAFVIELSTAGVVQEDPTENDPLLNNNNNNKKARNSTMSKNQICDWINSMADLSSVFPLLMGIIIFIFVYIEVKTKT